MEGKENGTTEFSEESKLLFTEEIPKWGRVAIMFFIPDCCSERESLKSMILERGGNIAIFHECFTYQIASPQDAKMPDFDEKYYKGMVYSSEWIKAWAKQGKLLPKEQYALRKIGKGKELDFEKGKIQYTIREVIIMYEWIKDKKLKQSKRTWQQMVDQGVLLCRTAESLKNFWKTNQKLSVDEWIEALLNKDAKYCHQYPNPVFPNSGLLTFTNGSCLEETKGNESSVKYPVKLTKSQGTPVKEDDSQEEQIEPFKKKAIINMHEVIDPNEDITPLREDLDFEIHVVSKIEDSSEENEEGSEHKYDQANIEIDKNEVVEYAVEESDEDIDAEIEAEIVKIVEEEIKDEEMLFCTTPPKIKESEVNEKQVDNIRLSQNSLSEFFNAYDSNTKNSEKPFKEKKEMLVELLNEDFGDNKFWKSPKSSEKDENMKFH